MFKLFCDEYLQIINNVYHNTKRIKALHSIYETMPIIFRSAERKSVQNAAFG